MDGNWQVTKLRGNNKGKVVNVDMCFLFFVMQAQAGWLQHDFGHLSVFKNSTWDHLVHKFVIGHIKVRDKDTYNYVPHKHLLISQTIITVCLIYAKTKSKWIEMD